MYLESESSSVWVRLLHPGHGYPMQPRYGYSKKLFKHKDALYYPSEEVVFLVTKRIPSNLGDVFTEVALWKPEEIRLLGTLALSTPEGGGMITFAPWYASMIPDISVASNLSSDDTIGACVDFAKQLRTSKKDENSDLYTFREIYRSDCDVEINLFENIDPEDGVLLRGLYTLLKSQLLISAFFMEEAFMNLQISREAAFQIIREHLQYIGNPKPSQQEIYKYIRSNFHMGEPLVESLKIDHEKWIETKHPLSPFGAGWASSLQADDVFEPYAPLISIYRHIVLDEPGRSSMLP